MSRLQEKVDKKPEAVRLLNVPDDFEVFCQSIVMRSGGQMRPFNPYEYQIILSGLIDRYNNVTVVKTRQLGTTQMIVAKFVHKAAQNPAFAASCFMRNDPDAEALLDRIRWLCEQSELGLDKDTAKLIRLINGAEIRTHNSSKEGNRSADSLGCLLFDEAAFQPRIKSIYSASVGSTILTGEDAKVIVVSTPSAKSGWYWDRLIENNGDRDIEDICKRVGDRELYSNNLPGFYWFEDNKGNCKVFIHWRCHPVYKHQEDFVEKMAARLDIPMEDADREFNLVFSDPAIEVFTAESIIAAQNSTRAPGRDTNHCFVGLYLSGTHCTAVSLVDNVVIRATSDRNPSPNTAINQVAAVSSGYSIASIVLKRADGGEEIAKRLRLQYPRARVLDITNSDLPNTIASLSLLLDDRAISIATYRNLTRNSPIAKHLSDFRRQDNKLGSLQPDKRDDCAWALAFSVRASESTFKRLPVGSS